MRAYPLSPYLAHGAPCRVPARHGVRRVPRPLPDVLLHVWQVTRAPHTEETKCQVWRYVAADGISSSHRKVSS